MCINLSYNFKVNYGPMDVHVFKLTNFECFFCLYFEYLLSLSPFTNGVMSCKKFTILLKRKKQQKLLLCSQSPNDVPPEPQRNVSIAMVRGAVCPSNKKKTEINNKKYIYQAVHDESSHLHRHCY